MLHCHFSLWSHELLFLFHPMSIAALQTDTTLALEAKLMKRWEFDSIAQAASCMTSWFTGTPAELRILKDYLNSIGIKFLCNLSFVV